VPGRPGPAQLAGRCWGVVASKLTHLHLYFHDHEVDAGAPNATIVNVASLHMYVSYVYISLTLASYSLTTHDAYTNNLKLAARVVAVAAAASRGAPAFGDVNVFDNELREGPDPASRLTGRAQGFAVNASLDGSSILSAIDFVFSGSTVTTQGQFDPAGGPSERSIVGGTC
jgi:hypothetical protein